MKPRLPAICMAMLLAPAALAAIPELCGECRVEKFASCGGLLEGITVDQSGGLWAVDLKSGRVYSITDSGQCTVRGNTGGQPNGARFAADGAMWIADKQKGLLKMDPQSGAVTAVVNNFHNEQLRGLNDLVLDAKGGVYFTEPYGSSALKPDGRVFYLPPGKDQHLQLVAGGLAFPNGIALSNDGNTLLIGEFALKRVTQMPSLASTNEFEFPLVFATSQAGYGPDGMLMRGDGILLAANFRAGEVLAWDAAGRPLGSIRLPADAGLDTTNVAIRAGWLYITEGDKGEIWRVRLTK
ncbi:MAG TPA: SMP-30/gluconolactonase/LRE family protein [Steroidobacteraceae bacterium]|nr:SMP-30/gluconolactonase/LRE family protein [Steroidobacteraceae bacterium]